MKTQKPVFLFAFANDQDNPLQLLREEERSLREVLVPAHDQGRIEVVQLGHASLEGIYNTFNRFHNRIALFHYGGHSTDQFLNLEDTNACSAALSTLIGQQRNLQLVFLNGCANRAQVKILFEKNVKAVIATSAPVDDRRALRFSAQFYHALANGKNIKEAFDTAKSKVQNDNDQLEIEYYRNIVLRDEKMEGFPWGLYAQDEAAVSWTMPQPTPVPADLDYFQEVALHIPDVNKELVLLTFEGMVEYDETHRLFFHSYQKNPTSALFNYLQNTLLDTFPSMVSLQIRDLFTPEGRSKGRVRLQEFSEAYCTVARLLCAIALANLWDAAIAEPSKKDFVIRTPYLRDISRYLEWSPAAGTPVDYFWLIRTVCCIFHENEVRPYVKELISLDQSMRDANEFYDAYHFLEQEVRQRLIANDIASQEVEPLCRETEHHFGKLLQQCAFLCNYQIVSVKVISVDLPRREPDPIFIHEKAILKGRDYATIDTEPVKRESTSSNDSVFITRNLEKDGLPLNLSPFLIDQNAFKVKKQYLPKMYFFDGMEDEKLHFLHADATKKNFVVTRTDNDPIYRHLERLFDMFDLFRQDLGLQRDFELAED
jgi:hypothetical protein